MLLINISIIMLQMLNILLSNDLWCSGYRNKIEITMLCDLLTVLKFEETYILQFSKRQFLN